jgi:hypothetical protein
MWKEAARPHAPARVRQLDLFLSGAARAFGPLAVLLPDPITPELLSLETKWAALASYGVTAPLLQEVLPINDALAPLHHSGARLHRHGTLGAGAGAGAVVVHRQLSGRTEHDSRHQR